MPYNGANLSLTAQGVGGAGGKVYNYFNADNDAIIAMDTNGYIADARARGMRVGDVVQTRSANGAIFSQHFVQAINANGSADLADSPAFSTDTD